MTVFVDSDILIEVSRGRDAAVLSRWIELSQSDALILFSPVTAAELWGGARPAEYAALEALFDALVCAPIDAAAGRRAGEYLRRYRKSHTVELGDALIAASAVASGALLWTRNRKHYPMPDLRSTTKRPARVSARCRGCLKALYQPLQLQLRNRLTMHLIRTIR